MVKKLSSGIFPMPLPDENCYSLLCRYALRHGLMTSNQISLELFGHTEPLAGYIFKPFRMSDLKKWFDEQTLERMPEFGTKHSSYPFYTAFMKSDDAEALRSCHKGSVLTTSQAKRINRECGFPKGHKNNLWYCPECVREDIKEHGETCWRRLPQMPGAVYCPVHKVKLRESGVSFRETNYLLIPATYALMHIPEPERENGTIYADRYIELAADIAWLLNNGFSVPYMDRYWVEARHLELGKNTVNDYKLYMASQSPLRGNRFEDYLVSRMMRDSGKDLLDDAAGRQISIILSIRKIADSAESFCTVQKNKGEQK